ncbi:UNVERIFIED_ORG: hypothetical protein M2435_002928 [Rhizobium sophorae]|nr:hypothetical protein [Rhizobium leguminosarum]MDH6660018.1 hypothetical protein [Rhizobium sophorae]
MLRPSRPIRHGIQAVIFVAIENFLAGRAEMPNYVNRMTANLV